MPGLMDKNEFVIFAGEDVARFVYEDAQRRATPGNRPGTLESESLVRIQRERAQLGFLGARLHATIHGWSVRYDSGLQDFGILHRATGYEAAIAWGQDWVMRDPSRRYFYASVSEVERGKKWIGTSIECRWWTDEEGDPCNDCLRCKRGGG